MPDAVIVGAGVAGSSLAIGLARVGWDVLLVERDRFPRHKVCGEFLSPEAQDSLRNLNLLEDLKKLLPVPLFQVELTTQRGNTLRVALPGVAWGLSRYALDTALAEAATRSGAILWEKTTVTAWSRHQDHYELQMRHQEQSIVVSTRAVIMACGRHSLPGLPPHYETPQKELSGWRRAVGVKSHYQRVAMPAQVELFLFPGGYVGINPVEAKRANVCLLMTYEAFNRTGQSIESAIAAAAAWNEAFARRLEGAQAIANTGRAVAPVDTLRRAEPWVGVACIGDTASMIPPLCGDGMAMALRSAELCTPLADAFLRGQLSLSAWARNYSAAWHDEFRWRLRIGHSLQSLLGLSVVSDALIGLGRGLPGLANYLVQATRGGGEYTKSSGVVTLSDLEG